MKVLSRLGIGLSLLITQQVMGADNNLQIMGSPLTVITSDNHQRSLNTCNDYIFLRMNDLKIKNIPDLPDRFMWMAKDALVHCYIDWYAQHHVLTKMENSSPPHIDAIISHFPASATLAVSDEEVKKLNATEDGKTMLEYTPSLHRVDNSKMISEKESVAYNLVWYQAYKNQDNQTIKFITLGSSVLEGTLGSVETYEIISENLIPWKVQQITENSTL